MKIPINDDALRSADDVLKEVGAHARIEPPDLNTLVVVAGGLLTKLAIVSDGSASSSVNWMAAETLALLAVLHKKLGNTDQHEQMLKALRVATSSRSAGGDPKAPVSDLRTTYEAKVSPTYLTRLTVER